MLGYTAVSATRFQSQMMRDSRLALSVVSSQWSVVNGQLSVVSLKPSLTFFPLLAREPMTRH
jgi:hypothetical protein